MPDPKPVDRTATDPQRPRERQKPGPTPGPTPGPGPAEAPVTGSTDTGTRSPGESGGRISEP
jgi:hypothetical protein